MYFFIESGGNLGVGRGNKPAFAPKEDYKVTKRETYPHIPSKRQVIKPIFNHGN